MVVVAPSSCGRRRPAVIILRSSSLLRPALVVTLHRRPAAPSPRCTVALLRRRLVVPSPCPCRRPAHLPPCYLAVLPIKPPSAALPSACCTVALLCSRPALAVALLLCRLAIRPSCLSSRHQPHCLQPPSVVLPISRHQPPCYPPCYPASYCPLSRPTVVALPGRRLAVKCRHCSPHIP